LRRGGVAAGRRKDTVALLEDGNREVDARAVHATRLAGKNVGTGRIDRVEWTTDLSDQTTHVTQSVRGAEHPETTLGEGQVLARNLSARIHESRKSGSSGVSRGV